MVYDIAFLEGIATQAGAFVDSNLAGIQPRSLAVFSLGVERNEANSFDKNCQWLLM